jgi:hypothetical protein
VYSFTINVRRRHLALAVVLLLIGVWVTHSDPAGAGADPPGEGIAVVYVAVGTGFADALGVGPGAGLNGAPIILVPTNPPLDPATEAELIRLDPKAVIIVGGTGVVSDVMETTLENLLPNAVVSRIAGTNRYKTNAAFSAATFPIEEWASISAAGLTGRVGATVSTTEGFTYATAGGDLVGEIQLPDGAQILELKVLGHDSSANNFTVSLYRITNQIATVTSAGNAGEGNWATTSITAGQDTVDNEWSGYSIRVASTGSFLGPRVVMVRYRLGAP